jgi:opacity protein-like surface antigen
LSLVFTIKAQITPVRNYSGFFDTYYYRGLLTYYAGAGMSLYRGDLSSTTGFDGAGLALTVGGHYKIWPHIVLGLEGSYFTFSGKDQNTERNLSFTGSGFELNAYGRLYIIDEKIRVAPDRHKERRVTFCKPYIQLGLGFLNYSNTATINSPSNLPPGTKIESYKNPAFTPILPIGFGFQFNINPRMSFTIDYIYRFTLTDYLDGVSELVKSTKNDGYGALMFKFQFAPSAKMKSKRKTLPPPAQYDGPKGTQTWKNRKKEEPAPKNTDTYELPEGDQEQNTEDQENQEVQEGEKQNKEQNPEDENQNNSSGQ